MSTVLFLLTVIGSFAAGWAFRSIRFAEDQDCANPNHRGNNCIGKNQENE